MEEFNLNSKQLEVTFNILDEFFEEHIVMEMRTYQTIELILENYLERLKTRPLLLKEKSTPKDA